MVTASIVSLVMAAVAATVSAFASYQGGKAQQKMYNAQAKLDEQNARNAALEASYNEDLQRRENRQRLSRVLAAQGEAGLVGGTATNAYLQSVQNAENDALMIRQQGLSAWQNYKNQAAMNRFNAKQAYQTGKANAFAQLASGATQTFFQGMEMKHNGFFSNGTKPNSGNFTSSGGYGNGYSYLGQDPSMFYK